MTAAQQGFDGTAAPEGRPASPGTGAPLPGAGPGEGRVPPGGGRTRARATGRVPFPTVDEITRHCLDEAEPDTVHIEIHLPRRPDPDRLRRAVSEALRRHPRILVRQTPSRWWHRRYVWELTDGPDSDPVSYPGGTLEESRRRALAFCPPMNATPPIRVEVIEHQGGWVLLTTINHTALDGPACLRVLATAAECYGGADNSPAPPPVRSGASAPDTAPPPATSPWARPARMAPETGEPGDRRAQRGVTGNGMLVTDLPVPARPPRTPDGRAAYTVNDQLLVATWIMSARWNRQHEQPRRPVRITMPVDDRPRTADMPIGNGTRLVEVTFGSEEAELYDTLTASGAPDRAAIDRLLRATAARTRALKQADRPQLGFSGDLLTTPLLPVGLRAAYTRALRAGAGPWASTTLLSNIGRVPYALDFGDAGRATGVWFSAPARSPRGLSVTTVSTGGRLQLALRWAHARFDDTAGRKLGELFAQALESTSYTPGGDGG
ncbi:condensation protein [Streptomyces sp. N2-109]|uniref:Condensation protein n=1 Tax=Streptomyces gossypii TaxID=2883101 RepID=A0ABT2JQX0_9ACTN|nr:condensation protein [Streptomyces gossypii]MCT2590282.1 condensation protein [Streptomyces gossypii]